MTGSRRLCRRIRAGRSPALLYRSGKKWQTVNGDYSAMRKFYEHVLGQEWDMEHLLHPRQERALPGILSTEEVERLINCGRTLKLPMGYTQSFHAAYPAADNCWALLPGWSKNLTLER